MLQGLESWKEKGLIQAETVQAATASYRASEDTLRPFIAECCITGDTVRAKLKELYEAYKEWADQSGEHAIKKTDFSERLIEGGFSIKPGTGNAYTVHGIGVKS